MPRTLTLRRRGSSFIETIDMEETALSTKRRYSTWEQVDKRLCEIGLAREEIVRLKAAFDSDADAALIRLPYRSGDAIDII